jgi:hypothetical protein
MAALTRTMFKSVSRTLSRNRSCRASSSPILFFSVQSSSRTTVPLNLSDTSSMRDSRTLKQRLPTAVSMDFSNSRTVPAERVNALSSPDSGFRKDAGFDTPARQMPFILIAIAPARSKTATYARIFVLARYLLSHTTIEESLRWIDAGE